MQCDFTAEDIAFLWSMNYTIYNKDLAENVSWGNRSLVTVETGSYRWNISLDVSEFPAGNYSITFRAVDTHNPAHGKGKERAENMIVDLNGELVGKKTGNKKTKEKESNTLTFKTVDPVLSDLYTIYFPDRKDSDVKSTVIWNDEHSNFKLLHAVKLEKVGKNYVNAVKVRIQAERLLLLRNSSKYFHILIGTEVDGLKWFWDAEDFRSMGGRIIVVEVNSTTIDFVMIHPTWGKNDETGKIIDTAWIDPLSGSINEQEITRNFTIIESILDERWGVGPAPGSDWTDYHLLIMITTIVIIAIALFIGYEILRGMNDYVS